MDLVAEEVGSKDNGEVLRVHLVAAAVGAVTAGRRDVEEGVEENGKDFTGLIRE